MVSTCFKLQHEMLQHPAKGFGRCWRSRDDVWKMFRLMMGLCPPSVQLWSLWLIYNWYVGLIDSHCPKSHHTWNLNDHLPNSSQQLHQATANSASVVTALWLTRGSICGCRSIGAGPGPCAKARRAAGRRCLGSMEEVQQRLPVTKSTSKPRMKQLAFRAMGDFGKAKRKGCRFSKKCPKCVFFGAWDAVILASPEPSTARGERNIFNKPKVEM